MHHLLSLDIFAWQLFVELISTHLFANHEAHR